MKRQKKFGWCILGISALLCANTGGAVAQDGMQGSSGNSTTMNGNSMGGMNKNAQMLINTLSEEKTEINLLAAQQAQFKKMGGRQNMRLASLWGRMIREHKAASPTLMRLTRKHGGDPAQAKIIMQPVLGSVETMIKATHKTHDMSVKTSQIRWGQTTDPAIKRAMSKRAKMARKHIRWMMPYHSIGGMSSSGQGMNGQQMAMTCPHCNVKMVNGKCPSCGMTMQQMKNTTEQ
jgi:rubrerythrin